MGGPDGDEKLMFMCVILHYLVYNFHINNEMYFLLYT